MLYSNILPQRNTSKMCEVALHLVWWISSLWWHFNTERKVEVIFRTAFSPESGGSFYVHSMNNNDQEWPHFSCSRGNYFFLILSSKTPHFLARQIHFDWLKPKKGQNSIYSSSWSTPLNSGCNRVSPHASLWQVIKPRQGYSRQDIQNSFFFAP